MPPTAREKWSSGAPKRRPSSSAIGRAPIAMMSRRMPPTPVAAPWNGSTAEGWLWLSALNATASPSPRSSTPAFSPGPCSTRAPALGSRFEQQRRVLVAAVLRPEEREDGELEVVRLPLQQLVDTVVLPVREAELAVEWLFRDGAQKRHLAAAPDGPPAPTGDGPHTARSAAFTVDEAVSRRDAPPPAPALRDLGIVVPLHQARRRRARAVGRRARPARLRRARSLLLPLLRGRGGLTPLRGHLVPLVVLGALNNAVPFWLLGFAETRLDSGPHGRDPGGRADLHGLLALADRRQPAGHGRRG